MAEYDVSGAFQDIEMYLIKSMQHNMSRHIGDEFDEDINWTQWQAEMLKGLDEYKKNNAEVLPDYFKTINAEIDKTIHQAYLTGESEQEIEILNSIKDGYNPKKSSYVRKTGDIKGEFFHINEEKLNALITATHSDMKKAETAVLRMADDVYRKTMVKAQMFYNAGASNIWQAVDMATKDFLKQGINSIQYANGARVNIASYAEMSLRTATKRAQLMGQGSRRDEWGIHTVLVSAHAAACPLCVQWQGKVYIDDVYGSGNAAESKATGYPLLSTAVKGGMFHPNCKNGCNTYYEGLNSKPKKPTAAEAKEQARNYDLTQKQRYYERNYRRNMRLANGTMDPTDAAMYRKRALDYKEKCLSLCDKYPDVLRYDKDRMNLRGVLNLDDPATLGIGQKKADAQAKAAVAEAKKKAKEQAAINKKLIDAKEAVDGYDKKAYEHIWKDPVTVEDYKSKKPSIAAKKQYFDNKLAMATDPEDVKKWKGLLNDLDDYVKDGAEYEMLLSDYKQAKFEHDLANGLINPDDAYSQARKDAALWAQSTKEADDRVREVCGKVWQDATQAERKAAYEYTAGSGSFNRPLRGYDGNWGSYKGPGNVPLNNEGSGKAIGDFTKMIDKSSYDFDMWLQRGCYSEGNAGFFNITQQEWLTAKNEDLQKFVGQAFTDDAFMSTGVAKGKGFSGDAIYNIYAPEGTKMLYCEPFSRYGNGSGLGWDGMASQGSFGSESEMLLQRGTTFRITKMERKNGRTYIDMEVIKQ